MLVLVSYFATLIEPENHDSTLHKALRKYQFTDATLISVGISSQVAIHLFLETFSFTRNPKLLIVTRWSVNIAYTAVNVTYWITLRYDSITAGLYLMLQYILMSLICFTLVSSLHVIDSDIWTLRKSLAIGVLMTLYYAFTFHNKRVLSFNSVLGILAFISYSSAALLLFSCAFTWHTKYLYKRNFAELELKEKLRKDVLFGNASVECSICVSYLWRNKAGGFGRNIRHSILVRYFREQRNVINGLRSETSFRGSASFGKSSVSKCLYFDLQTCV